MVGFTSKTNKSVINHIFMIEKNKSHTEKNKPLSIFSLIRGACGAEE